MLILNRNGASIKNENIPTEHMWFRCLTLKYVPKHGPPQFIYNYRRGPNFTKIPRAHALTMLKPFLERGIQPYIYFADRPIPDELDNDLDLTPNQQIVVDRIVNNLTSNGSYGQMTLNMPAGHGKTRVAAAIIARLAAKTLYIVPKRPLVGQVGETMSLVNGADVTTMVINSAMKLTLDAINQYDLVIFDEVHEYCSDKRKEIFWNTAGVRYILAMSATTAEREDGFDKLYYHHCGIPVHATRLPGWANDAVHFDIDVDLIRYYGPSEHTKALTHESTGKIFCHYMNQQALSDSHRMKLAVDEIVKLYNDPIRYVYVFCEELEAIASIRAAIIEALGEDAIAAPEIFDFVGGSGAIPANARILLSTYGYAGTGLSRGEMNSIVFLTSRKAKMKQIVARILRLDGDRTIRRKIVDIVDQKTAIGRQVNVRIKAYEHYHANVNERKVKYSEIDMPVK